MLVVIEVMKKQTNKEKKNYTWKQKTAYFGGILLIGVMAYFLGSGITKAIMRQQNSEKNKQQFDSAPYITTTKPLLFTTFLKQFNQYILEKELPAYQLKQEQFLEKEGVLEIQLNDITFSFVVKEEVLELSAIQYAKETTISKQLAYGLMKANQVTLTEETIDLLYRRVIETMEHTVNESESISEYFQYQGLEVSLYHRKKPTVFYQFRIGRLTK